MTEAYETAPPPARHLLVYLHGHGSSPAELHPYFRQHHDDGYLRVCPQATTATDGGWSWFDSGPRGVDRTSLAASVARIRSLVDATLADLGASWSQVVLGGFSQGAAAAIAVAADLAADGSPPLAGLLLQAGFVPEVLDDEPDVGAIAARRVLIQHGDADEVVPVVMAADLGLLIAADRPDREVAVEVVDGGHTLSAPMLDGARRWLGALVAGA